MKVAAIIPCFLSLSTAPSVIKETLRYVDYVICVDDKCPQLTGKSIQKIFNEDKVFVIYNSKQMGVGGAVKIGIKKALEFEPDIVLKIDSDGQMNPKLIPKLIEPILKGNAEMTKGNRFKNINKIIKMPLLRLIGNSSLGFITRLSTGYWELFDPTNGFIALRADLFESLFLEKVDNRYFFETDLLFRCSLSNVLIQEVYMEPIYLKNGISSLNPLFEIINFSIKNLIIFFKRICYQYFLFEINPGSIQLLLSIFSGLISFFTISKSIYINIILDDYTPVGDLTLFLASIIISIQMFLGFIYYDTSQKTIMRRLNFLSKRI